MGPISTSTPNVDLGHSKVGLDALSPPRTSRCFQASGFAAVFVLLPVIPEGGWCLAIEIVAATFSLVDSICQALLVAAVVVDYLRV